MSNECLKNFTQTRVVRVFISSTFSDMQEEREELVKRIFPQIRKLCEERGVTFVDVDLRWGVTDEQKAEGKVLPICLKEIDNCRPFFIGILGERYGWIPEKIPDEVIAQQPWLADHKTSSVTELEIMHGVLKNPKMSSRAYFYLRNPSYIKELPAEKRSGFEENIPERREKLARLKSRIRQSGLAVRENYHNPRDFGQLVLKDLTDAINQEFPVGTELAPLDREAAEHEMFARSRAVVEVSPGEFSGVYIERKEYFDRLDEHAKGDGPPLVITGESGCGKSALLANWALKYRQAHPDELMIMHFIGASSFSCDLAVMLRRVMGELKRCFDIKQEIPNEFNQTRLVFSDWLKMVSGEKRIILIFDALNQLEGREGILDLAWLPKEIVSNIRLIVSTLPGKLFEDVKERRWPVLEVVPLLDNERRELIIKYLMQYRKTLGPVNVERIAASKQSTNPLYLKTLLEELRLFGEHEKLNERINVYLAADTIPQLYEKILARYEEDYERDRPKLVRDAMSLLWAARRGLSETELRELLGEKDKPLARAVWSPLFLAAEHSFVNKQGLIGFGHAHFRTAVRSKYLPSEEFCRKLHMLLAGYFALKPVNDKPLQLSGKDLSGLPCDERVCEEVPWQLKEAQDWEWLRNFLCDWNLFVSLFNRRPYELLEYWLVIGKRYNLVDSYQEALRKEWMPVVEKEKPYLKILMLTALADFFDMSGNLEAEKNINEILLRESEGSKIAGICKTIVQGADSGILFHQGFHKEAEKQARKSLEGFEKSFGRRDPTTAVSMIRLAEALIPLEQFDEAKSLYLEAMDVLREKGRQADPNLFKIQHDLGHLYEHQGNYTEAVKYLEEALEQQKRMLGDEDSKTLSTMACLATVLKKNGNLEAAEKLYRTSFEGSKKILGLEHPQTLHAGQYLAKLYHIRKKLSEAEKVLRQVLKASERVAGLNTPVTLERAYLLACVLKDCDQLSGAEKLFQRCVEEFSRQNIFNTEAAAASLLNWHELLAKRKDQEAIPNYNRHLLAFSQNVLGPEHPDTLLTKQIEAKILWDKKDLEAAEKLYRDVLAGWKKQPGFPNEEAKLCIEELADLLIEKGNSEEAFLLYSTLLNKMEGGHG